jgi:hypothetical protein
MSTPRDIQAGVPQGSVLHHHIVQSIYKWYASNTWCLSRSLCWWHLHICDRPQRRLWYQKSAARSQRYCDVVWALENNEDEDKTQAIYFSHRLRPPKYHLTLNGWNIPFVNHVKYLGLIFYKRITWRLHIEMTDAKDFRTSIRIYSLLKWAFKRHY